MTDTAINTLPSMAAESLRQPQNINWVDMDFNKAFGIVPKKPNAPAPMIKGAEPGCMNVPPRDPDYYWHESALRDMAVFWASGFRAAKLEGDPAAGKSSLVLQFLNRLNVPCHVIACRPFLTDEQLWGCYLPTETGGLRWQDGPITAACRNGSAVLLDEYNLLQPDNASKLNAVLEGYPFTIPETGEWIVPHERTRFFATQNAVDGKVVVTGRNVQDSANNDRFFNMEVERLPFDVEEAIVVKFLIKCGVVSNVAEQVAKVVRKVSESIYKSFTDPDPTKVSAMDGPMSLRAMLRWAQLSIMYGNMKEKAMIHAVTRAFDMSEAMRAAVITLVEAQTGIKSDPAP